MLHQAARLIMMAVVGVVLLTSNGVVQAGPLINVSASSCCICSRCFGGATCAPIADATECSKFCGGLNATACGDEVVNLSCSSPALASECQLTGAPVLGTTGLTIMSIVLSAFGIMGLRRAARRQRA